MTDHDDVRAKIAPLTDALTNCVTELELLPIEHRERVMRALNALFPDKPGVVIQGLPASWSQQGGGMVSPKYGL